MFPIAKDAAKALGARFDCSLKRWYIEAGVDLIAFTARLPAGVEAAAESTSGPAIQLPSGAGLANVKKSIALSRLLGGVASAVAQAFASGVWTLVEVKKQLCATATCSSRSQSGTVQASQLPGHAQ
jgi:exodeoxyribonuclease VII large subunit